jgi:hypothetical protein
MSSGPMRYLDFAEFPFQALRCISSFSEGRLLAVLSDTRPYDHLARTLEALRSLELA